MGVKLKKAITNDLYDVDFFIYANYFDDNDAIKKMSKKLENNLHKLNKILIIGII